MQRTLSAFLAWFIALSAPAQVTVVDLSARQQTLEGWGVSLCWWANMCGRWSNEASLDTLLTWLCSPRHLGYSLFRYNIGGGDDPQWTHCTPHHFGARRGKGLRAEMEGFQVAADGAYHWERDAAQRRVLLRLKQLRPDAQFEAFSNSPPYFMTVSGCCAGAQVATDDNLRPDCYEAFAQYLIDVCLHFRDSLGIEFLTLEPFNEPMTDYWQANGGQEGCHFDVTSQLAFLKVLSPRLSASGLKTRLSASDETSVQQSVRDLEAYLADGDAVEDLWQWNTHSYEATDSARVRLRELASAVGLRLWQSETGASGRGLHGNLQMAQRLIDDMRLLQPTAWMDWQYVEEHGDQWSLVQSDWQNEEFRRVKNYYVRYHFTHFIRPGYTFLLTDQPQTLAAVSPEGDEVVIVLVNTVPNHSAPHTLALQGFQPQRVQAWRTTQHEDAAPTDDFAFSNGQISLSLPPLSIVTLVLR